MGVHSWGVHTKGINGGDDALRVKLVCVALYILGGEGVGVGAGAAHRVSLSDVDCV